MHKFCLIAVLLSASSASAFGFQGAGSPAELRIANANREIAAEPKQAQPRNDLALASIRRARETGDPRFLIDAQTALNTGLQLAPGDFQLRKTGVALLLAQGRLPEALTQAEALNRQAPDDVAVWSYVAEASIALGRYPQAEKAAQWMMNLRANNTPALLVGAELRAVWGDTPGALQFLNQAFNQTPPIEPEELCRIANRMAALELAAGRLDEAAQALARAEALFPGSPVTIANLARLRIAQGKPRDAIAPLKQRLAEEQNRHAPQARTLFLLAQAEQAAGDPGAAAEFARFAASAPEDDTQTELILYDAGLPGLASADPKAALALASRRVAVQQDVDTLDAYAWALYANGQYAQAQTEINQALAVGTRSARLFAHAGAIAAKLKQPEQAAQQYAAALTADPTSPYAGEARRDSSGPAPAPPALAVSPAAPAKPQAEPVIPIQEVADPGGVPAALLLPRPTGTARAIKKMQALVQADPHNAKAYAGLGAAFEQRARETGDVDDFELAEQALQKSLDLNHSDLAAAPAFESLAEVYMGEHRFTDALQYAEKALALGSGDLSPFAIVGDAEADMGEYAKAGVAYAHLQSVASAGQGADYAQHTRTAYLQFISGDTPGAIVAMRGAIGEGIVAHLPSENLAWLYFEQGEFQFQAGEVQDAADAYLTALTINPGNYRALAGLGKVRAAQGQPAQAITLYAAAIAVVPYPLYIAELADLYTETGNPAEARKQADLIAYIGKLGHINQVLHNRDLALFYADHDTHLPEALALARKEFEVRSDIYTWDALAWALYKNGKYAEADQAMAHALRLGTRDAKLLYHAGMISAKLGRGEQARSQLAEAMAINPHFGVLAPAVASQELNALSPAKPAMASRAGGQVHDAR